MTTFTTIKKTYLESYEVQKLIKFKKRRPLTTKAVNDAQMSLHSQFTDLETCQTPFVKTIQTANYLQPMSN